MKPIFLMIEGLHSFREKQTIRFDELSDAGVFGIFGPTGSGKSSILDAITLALYGSVGRAKNGTQGILNHAEKSLSVSFQFQIGAGTDRKIYRVDRRYAKNTDITVKNTYSRLTELDANGEPLAVLADKDREVTQQAQDLLGLKEDDFSRAVVLPQGKFADFLQLTGKDRRQMLQRLFGLQQYGFVLANRLNQRLHETERNHGEVQAEQMGMGDCSTAALETAERQLQTAKEKEEAAIRAFSEANKNYETAKQIVEWQQQLTETNEKIGQHEAYAAEMQALTDRIRTSEKAEKVLPYVKQFEATKEEEQSRLNRRNELEAAIGTLRSETEHAWRAFEAAQQEKQQKSPELIKQQTQLESAFELEDEMRTLTGKVNELQQQYDQKQTKHVTVRADIQSLTQQQKDLSTVFLQQKELIDQNTVPPEYRALVQDAVKKSDACSLLATDAKEAEAEVEKRSQEVARGQGLWEKEKEQLQTLSAELEACEKKVQELQNNSPVTEEQLTKKEIRLVECKGQSDQLVQLEKEYEEHSAQVTSIESELQQLADTLQVTSGQLQSAREHLAALRIRYQEAILQDKRAMAVKLAADLCQGEACPVCGSVDHPHPAVAFNPVEDASDEVQRLKTEIQEAEILTGKLSDEETSLKSEISAKNIQCNSLHGSIEKLSEEIRKIHTELSEQVSITTEGYTGEQFLEAIRQERALIDQQRAELDAWKNELKEAEDNVRRLKDKYGQFSSNAAVYEQQVKTAQTELENAQVILNKKTQLAQEAEAALQTALASVGVEQIGEATKELQEKDRCVSDARKRQNELQEQLDRLALDLTDKQQTESDLRAELTGLATNLADSNSNLEEKQKKLNQITNGVPARELREQVVNNLNALTENEETTKKIYEQKNNELTESERQLEQAKTRSDEIAERLEALQQELQQKLQEENFTTPGEVKDAILLPAELSEMKNRVQTYQELGTALKNEKEKLEKSLNGQSVSDETWQQIRQALEDAEQNRQNATLTIGAANLQYQELREKHNRWAELESQRLLLAKQLGYLNQLKDVLKGDKFVEFLAQEQLDFVARQASDRLKRLTRNRYALEVAEDGGFIMRDDANGGVKRPVTSLSGGETFLTSLALALSLSTQIQLRGKYPLEFFFLDEGFGTLDPELLDVVMSTLEQLHLEKMTIGVISHVPELQQRLHRRLIVEPAEAAGRGSRVRMERS